MIYAFNSTEVPEKIADSVKFTQISRFGWGYVTHCDLEKLKTMEWADMDEAQAETWKRANFLLQIEAGDWIVHINTPSYGQCIAAKVVESYSFDEIGIEGDYRHCLKIDADSLFQFDRNDSLVHPTITRRLKLQGHYWRIYYEAEWLETITALKSKGEGVSIENKGIYHLRKDVSSIFRDLTQKIQLTHPEKKLEYLLCDIFNNIPNVKEARVNGSGWRTDHGADIIVEYNGGLDILNLQKQERLVIQVKSYVGEHFDLHCIDQLREAVDVYAADCALLITTAEPTPQLETAIRTLGEELGKPVALMAAGDVAKFILKFDKGKLIEL